MVVRVEVFVFADLRAQDLIFESDSSKLTVKVLEKDAGSIKYKMFNNLNGPTYIDNKTNILYIKYENGQIEVFSQPHVTNRNAAYSQHKRNPSKLISKADSSIFYKYSKSISINFLNFINREVGLIYQKDFFKKQFNIIVPLAIGIEAPKLTQNVYFNIDAFSGNGYSTLTLNRKNFEIGLGINYYPSLKTKVNYFIGPVLRYLQYDVSNVYISRSGSIIKNSTVHRTCASITNGFVFRTKSRLTATLFTSIGFKNDYLTNRVTDPATKTKIDPVSSARSLYFWGGVNIGFSLK